MILQANCLPGLDMTLTEFSQLYQLYPETERKFMEHRYRHARMLRFVTQEDLTAMGFLRGEIVAVRDAVEHWSQAPAQGVILP
jgi:hypothetical protein